jgi:hypothetical protein
MRARASEWLDKAAIHDVGNGSGATTLELSISLPVYPQQLT